ncbi:XRE family transcriptional regulator [Parasedimentitalea marina]|uniref:XRE family transcriptional regulator n=1 Tax=Parasedimentitalea marina TaxID=2483033 RepID=A0A3T0N1G3_9RHOB|nr:helix-turn-helix domain-containing protein [Parasedimentitalea marina]AZV77864.1 XRE family transcriptional regulator [Parasedimentitalea marina]
MDAEARKRLRIAIAASNITGQSICDKYGWPKNYVSRVVNGDIKGPDPTRLLHICDELNVGIVYVLTGRQTTSDRQNLLNEIAQSPQEVIDQVADFVRDIGLGSES